MFSTFKKICCIESSTFFYFLKLQRKILHLSCSRDTQKLLATVFTHQSKTSKYFPNITEGPEPVSPKRSDPKSRRGCWALPRLRGEVGTAALSSRRDAQLWNKPGEQPVSGREYAGEWREGERMRRRSVCLSVYLADSSLLASSPPDTSGGPFLALSPPPLGERTLPPSFPAVYQAPLNTAGDLCPRPGSSAGAQSALPPPPPAMRNARLPRTTAARQDWETVIAGLSKLSFAQSGRHIRALIVSLR